MHNRRILPRAAPTIHTSNNACKDRLGPAPPVSTKQPLADPVRITAAWAAPLVRAKAWESQLRKTNTIHRKAVAKSILAPTTVVPRSCSIRIAQARPPLE